MTVEQLMGLALGCVRMSMDDFRQCTPSEFTTVFNAWKQQEDHWERLSWEQARFVSCCILQPHSKRKLSLTDICRFSWEDTPQQKSDQAEKRKEEASSQKRFEEIANLWGDS